MFRFTYEVLFLTLGSSLHLRGVNVYTRKHGGIRRSLWAGKALCKKAFCVVYTIWEETQILDTSE